MQFVRRVRSQVGSGESTPRPSTSTPPPPRTISPPPPSYHTAASRSPSPAATLTDTTTTQGDLGPTVHNRPPSYAPESTGSFSARLPSSTTQAPPTSVPSEEEVVLHWTPDDSNVADNQPKRYSFSPLGFNTMLIVPTAEQSDRTPLYHITVQMNCLRPAWYITTLRRGASELGPYIGEFEYHSGPRETTDMRYSRVVLGSESKPLRRPTIERTSIMEQGHRQPILNWNLGRVAIRWRYPSGWKHKGMIEPQCFLVDPQRPKALNDLPLLATLHHPNPAGARTGERPVNSVTITKKGREAGLVDHIIVTALILQRDIYSVN